MIKKILITLAIFAVIYWFQTIEDKKTNKIRVTLFDKYKLPLLVASITGLILTLNLNKCQEIHIVKNHVESVKPMSTLQSIPTILQSILHDKSIRATAPEFSTRNNLIDQEIYTDLPNF